MKLLLHLNKDIEIKIQEIRNELYKNNYRIDGKLSPSLHPHITIAIFSDTESINSYREFSNIYSKFSSNVISNYNLVNKPTGKSNWVALEIYDKWLKDFNKEIEELLNNLQINESKAYKEKIKNIRQQFRSENTPLDDCIADHINLLNKCKPEFSNNAYDRFLFLNDLAEIPTGKISIKV